MIPFSIDFFDLITSSSARTIFSILSQSKEPVQYVRTPEIPSSDHFHWCASKIAEKYGEINQHLYDDVIFYGFCTQKYKEYYNIYDTIKSNFTKNTITIDQILKLYNDSRNLFIYLITRYPQILSKLDTMVLFDSMHKFDYAIFDKISEELCLVQASIDIPEQEFKNHLLIIQSALESNNKNLQRNVQDLLGTSDLIESNSVLHNIQLTISGRQHFDDIFLQPLINLLENFNFKAAKEYSSYAQAHLVSAYLLRFPKLISNRAFIESTLPQIIDTPNLPEIFSVFLQCIQNDLYITSEFSQMTGQRITLEDLSNYSLPYLVQPIIDTISTEMIDFLSKSVSYCIPSCYDDFVFFISYIIISNILTNFDPSFVLSTLRYIEDPLTLRWLLVDIFSLIFIQKDGKYIFSFEKVVQILNILNEFPKNMCMKYIEHAKHKIECLGDNIEINNIFEPIESLVHPLLIRRDWPAAKSICSLGSKYESFIELCESVDAYVQNLDFTTLTYEENKRMFNIEIGLSLNTKEHLNNSFSDNLNLQTIINRRIKIKDSAAIISPYELFRKKLNATRNLDKAFVDRNKLLKTFSNIGNDKYLNAFIDFINVYIQVGAKTPALFGEMQIMKTINELIESGKFDLALEFCGVNHVDFFSLLFVNYKANEAIIKMISPMFPLASFTMALTSMKPVDLIKYQQIIVPKDASPEMLKYFNQKVKINEKKPVNKDIIDLIVTNSKELDDYLFNIDTESLKQAVLCAKQRIPFQRFSALLDHLYCFCSDREIQDLRLMVMFMGQLEHPPATFNDAVDKVNVEKRICELIQKQKYKSARQLSEYCDCINVYIKYVVETIETLVSNNQTIIEIMKSSINLHHEILDKIPKDKYNVRYEVIRSSVDLLNDKDLSQEFLNLQVFFSIPEIKRPFNAEVSEVIAKLADIFDIIELEKLASNFKLDFSTFVNKASLKAYEIISFYSVDTKLSLPLLIPLINSLTELLNQYQPFSKHCSKFGDAFIPIIAILAGFINVDCNEHEAFCKQVIIFLKVFIRRIYQLTSEHEKHELDIILDQINIIGSLQSISFFSRFQIPYGFDTSLYDHQFCSILMNNDFLEQSLLFRTKNYYIQPTSFLTLLKMHEYEKAREYFSNYIKMNLKKNYRNAIPDFTSSIYWAINSPLCLTDEYIKNPSAFQNLISFREQAEMYIASNTPAFFPSATSENAFYIDQLNGLSASVNFITMHGSLDASFKVLLQQNFDTELFLYGILIPSLTVGKFDKMMELLTTYDEYLEHSQEALQYSIIWSRNRYLHRLTYTLDVLLGDFEDAVSMVELLYAKETNLEIRKKIIEKAFDDIPQEVLSFQKIEYQKQFLKLCKEKKITLSLENHLFLDNIYKSLAILIENKQESFALTIATDLKTDPTQTCAILASKFTKYRKAENFVNFLQTFCKTSIFENWVTAFLKSLAENPKTLDFVHKIISKEIKSNKFKCHLLILFGFNEEARQLAEKYGYEEFLLLLSF